MKTIRVKDHPGLIRDPVSKAIINIDQEAYNDHKNRKNMQTKVIELQNEMEEVKNSLREIKELILQIKN